MFNVFILFISFVFVQDLEHFIVEIEETGESTLFIFQDSISSLDEGDELGLFDVGGMIDDEGNIGEILVGAGLWQESQLEIIAISSQDLSQFGGPILSGAISGNTMVLKVWDSSGNTEYEADYNISSGSGTFNGLFSAINEISFDFNENSSVDINLDLLNGWNWVSLNVLSDDMSLNSVLSSIDGSAEFIKSQSGYSNYYPTYGWFGNLDEIDNVSMYKLRMIENDAMEFTGIPINVSETVLNLSDGWNWIGYTPQNESDINLALTNIPDGSAEFIKSQSGYSNYYETYGWFGNLDVMQPLEGYLLRMAQGTNFVYGTDGMARTVSFDNNTYDEFDLNIHDYEHNATMTSAVYIDAERVDSYDYVLSAYNDSKCVGYTEGLYFPLDGSIVFPLMVYGNEAGNALTLKVYNKTTQTYLDIEEEFIFTPDMTLGDGLDPVVLNSTQTPASYSISAAYPNPFNPVVNFDVNLDGEHHVNAIVYNISGQQVGVVYDGMLSGSSKLSWMAENQASGIYFIKVAVDGVLETSNKIILLK